MLILILKNGRSIPLKSLQSYIFFDSFYKNKKNHAFDMVFSYRNFLIIGI
jgi:hypothetical protein